jgi:hypothetical protein
MKNKNSVLHEGMRENDLVDLVLPLISVDEYVSKIDPTEAIVLGFYVQDEAAAKDLNRFLQKSPVPLLGTDVSPAPDQHGYYMVFVEMMDNDRLVQNLEAILQEMSTLVDIEHWKLRIRAQDELVDFTPDALKKGLDFAKKHSKKTEVVEFLQRSALHNAEFDNSLVILEGGGQRFVFDFVGFDRISKLMQDHQLDQAALRYDIRNIAKNNKIGNMLGEHWDVSRIGGYVMLYHDSDTRGLLLKL